MPQPLNTKNVNIEEPLTIHFECENCGHEFTREGKITCSGKAQSNIDDQNDPSQQAHNYALGRLSLAHDLLDSMISEGIVQTNTDEKDITITIHGNNKCPNCGYTQRIIPKKVNQKKKKKFTTQRMLMWTWGTILLTMFIFTYVFYTYAQLRTFLNTFKLVPLLVGLLLVLVPITLLMINYYFKDRKQNKRAKNRLKEEALPTPKMPAVTFGQQKTF